MAKECTKAAVRRAADPNFVNRYFVGKGIDIGGAPDPLSLHVEFFPRMTELSVWDRPQGDAQFMDGVADETYDFVHSSHCLEHLNDPAVGLQNWFRIVKPGGHLVMIVPDEDLYEQRVWPSTFNDDHKWTFTVKKSGSWSQQSLNLLDLILSLGPAADMRSLLVLDAGFRYTLPRFDQTLMPNVECGIEVVVRKRLAQEITDGGRIPPNGTIDPALHYILTGRSVEARPPGEILEVAIRELQAGHIDSAEKLCREVIGAGDENMADAFYVLGLVLRRRGNIPGAMRNFRMALTAQPEFPEVYSSIGKAMESVGAQAAAAASLRIAVALHPTYAEPWLNLGRIRADQGATKAASDCLRRALRMRPNAPDILELLNKVDGAQN